MYQERQCLTAHGTYKISESFINSDGPVLVFFHGGPGNNTIAERKYIAAQMAEKYNVVWVDQLGCYHSVAKDLDEVTLDNTLEDLAKILGPYEDRKVVPLGFCVGCHLVHHFAHRYPHLVGDVVLMGVTMDTGQVFQDLLKRHLDDGNLVLTAEIENDFKLLMDVNSDQYGINQLQAFGNIVQRISRWNDLYWHNKEAMGHFFEICGENALSVDVFFRIQAGLFIEKMPDLKAIYSNKRVLIIQGEYDQIATWETNGKFLKEIIPHALTDFVANAGHWCHLESPEQFLIKLDSFFEGL